MKITLDVSPTAQGHAGLGRYAGEVARALAEHEPQADLTLFYNETQPSDHLPDNLTRLPSQIVSMGNKPWRMGVMASSFLRWPMDSTFGATQIFHATNHLLAHFSQAKTVYTLHDLIFLHYPEYHLFYNRWYLTLTMPRYLQTADMIITPSECSKQDALRFYDLPEEKFRVIYEAPAPTFQPSHDADLLQQVKQRYQLPDQFVLHVGTIEPRKNLSRLLEAFQPLLSDWPDLRLVLIGKKGWLYDQFFQRLQQLGLEERVIFPGFVAEEDLPAIYQLATVFVYPSLYEGFGLPPIEAMACGTPVVSSNSSSLPEVVGDAGLLIDPNDSQAIHVAMQRVLSSADLRADLAERGLKQAAKFSWQQAASELMDVYRALAR
ncbi:glycosyltransferase family 1 protein [Anaerolineales bacterium HSG6]|nr:glycosyltransferase family 1 protein [Anaerolineales bacterium HSG6]